MNTNSSLKILIESKVGIRFKGETLDLVNFIEGVLEKFSEEKLHELDKKEILRFLEDRKLVYSQFKELAPVEGIKIQYLNENDDFGPHVLMLLDDFFSHESEELERFKRAIDETKRDFS